MERTSGERWKHPGLVTAAAAVLLVLGCSTGEHAARPPSRTAAAPVEASAPPIATPQAPPAATAGIEFLGAVEIPSGFKFENTVVGGLSGLTYDAGREVYYAISDDRSEHGAARFYTLRIDLADGRLDPGDVTVEGVTTLLDGAGKPFAKGAIDAEGIALVGENLFISSEGDVKNGVAPFIRRFGLDGRQLGSLPLPSYYLPDATAEVGVRNNLAFESLTAAPDGSVLVTATENALVQDGPEADVGVGSPSRILVYDLRVGVPAAEYVYPVAPVPRAPIVAGTFRVNGLVELLALDGRTFLALERAYAAGAGYTIKLFRISLAGASSVFAQPRLLGTGGAGGTGRVGAGLRPVTKTELVDFGDLLGHHDLALDNLEGMVLAPRLADGRRPLVVVADDNFSEGDQRTLFVALALPSSP
jgi:hypothetical protein